MKLHGYFRSSATYRVRIALALKRLQYEDVFHHLGREEQRDAEYLALNPQGLIPALEDEGEIFTQSLAILEYLNETEPEPALLPGHPADRARVRSLAQIICCDIHPVATLRVRAYLAETLDQSETAVDAWCRHWIELGLTAFEAFIAGDDRTGMFCHGDEPSIADICLIPQVLNAERLGMNLDGYPTIRRIYDTCMGLEAFAQAHPNNQPDTELP